MEKCWKKSFLALGIIGMLVLPSEEVLSTINVWQSPSNNIIDSRNLAGHIMHDDIFGRYLMAEERCPEDRWRRGSPLCDGQQMPYDEEIRWQSANPNGEKLNINEPFRHLFEGDHQLFS